MLTNDLAVFQHDHLIGELGGFRGVVGHIHDRDAQLVANPLEVRQDPPAAFDVHGGQRLIQQKQLRSETGHEVESLEVEVKELEPRIAPRSVGTFF